MNARYIDLAGMQLLRPGGSVNLFLGRIDPFRRMSLGHSVEARGGIAGIFTVAHTG